MPHSPHPKRPDEGLKWLDEILEEEKPTVIRARKKVAPLSEPSSPPAGDTIEVECRWLIPPTRSGKRGKTSEAPPKRPQPALPAGSQRRGKLPPPLPR
jgi:hypothetical protein